MDSLCRKISLLTLVVVITVGSIGPLFFSSSDAIHAIDGAISFDANGGEGDVPPGDSITGGIPTPDSTIYYTIPDIHPTRSGYEFLGWAESKTATVPTHFAGDEVSCYDEYITFYAVWGIASRTVSFSSEGSVIHTETVEPNATVQPYTPSAREGYTFGGWYTDITFQTPFDFNTPITSNITLYAKWIESPVTIKFYVEGQVHSTLQVPRGSVGVVYTPIMVTGVFAGWFYDAGFTQKYDATVALTGDINLYAMGVPPLIFTSEPNAAANIQQVNSYGMFFFDATDSSGRYQIHWDFGDGNTSDEAIAYNTYSEPGLYTVTLTVTNIYGESATSTYEIDLRNGSAANDVKWFAIGALCVIVAGFVVRRIL